MRKGLLSLERIKKKMFEDEPMPYDANNAGQQAQLFVDSLLAFDYYSPLKARLKELNARFMNNERDKSNDVR